MATQKIKERFVTVEWGDVKRKFLDVVGGGQPWKGVNASNHTAREFIKAGKGNPDGPPKCSHDCVATRFEKTSCMHSRSKREEYWVDQHHKDYDGKWVGGYKTRIIPGCEYCLWAGQQSWVGGSYGQTLGWLRNGYRAPEFEHSAAYVPMAERKRPTWSEEPDGDLDIGRLYGGYDNAYLAIAEQEKKPGLRVLVEYAFACGVESKTIEQYGAWVAGLLGALESTGYDLTVDMWIPLDGLFTDQHIRDNVLVRVKRQNEVSDFTEWSALFSPTGYRHVGFCAKLVAGDKLNVLASDTLGTTLGGKGWGLNYDSEESILRVNVDQRGHDRYGGDAFPKDRLNEQAVKLGLIPEIVKQ